MPAQDIEDLISRALAEDVGTGDLTTQAVVEPGRRARALIVQKAPGIVSGLDVADKIRAVATATKAGHGDVPTQDVVVKSVRRA